VGVHTALEVLLEAKNFDLVDRLLDVLDAVYAEDTAEDDHDAVDDGGKGKQKLDDDSNTTTTDTYTSSVIVAVGRWQWEGDSSDWNDYDDVANHLIEKAYGLGTLLLRLLLAMLLAQQFGGLTRFLVCRCCDGAPNARLFRRRSRLHDRPVSTQAEEQCNKLFA
jgi:hypothetical protein